MFVLLYIFGISPVLSAEALPDSGTDVPISVKAEDLNFDQQTGVMNAYGSVEAALEDLVLNADTLSVDTNTSIATAEGNVVLSKKGYRATGSKMTYDLKTGLSNISDFTASASVDGIKGLIYLKTKDMRDKGDIKTGSEGSATSCEQGEPHYVVKAKQFYFKPDDKLVASGATMYVQDKPVMWLPFYIYDLAKRRVSLTMPIFGSNNVEGDFVKTELQYYIDEGGSGSAYFDFMKKKGNGYGLDHDYAFGKHSGNMFLYHVPEADTGIRDWVAKLNHEISFGGRSKLKFGYDYRNIYLVPSGRLDQGGGNAELTLGDDKRNVLIGVNGFENRMSLLKDYSFRLSGNYDNVKTDYNYNFRGNMVAPKWQNISQGFVYEQNITDRLRAAFRANYYMTITGETYPMDQRIEPGIDITYSDPRVTMKVSEYTFIDPDSDTYTADNNAEYVERIPEASVALNNLSIETVSIRPEIAFGRFHESKYMSLTNSQRHFTTNRYKYGLVADRAFPVGMGTILTLSGAMEQFNYDTGDQRYTLRETASLGTDLGGFFLNTVNYTRGYNEGNTPFFFDSFGSIYHTLKDTMVFYKGSEHRLTFDGGYNYSTSKYFDLLVNYDSNPSASLHLNLGSGYDIENKRWRDLVSLFQLSPLAGLKEDLSHTYDLNTGLTKSASSLFSWQTGDTWQGRWSFKLGHTYDQARGAVILQEATVVKDLHCWEAAYTWSEFRKEFRITFTLKAFPDRPIGFASGNSGFFIDGMSGASGTSGGSSQRY